MGPKIPYLNYSVNRLEFEGIDAVGNELIIPGNYLGGPSASPLPHNPQKIFADKLICTTSDGWAIQQKWENSNCH